ncbi:MAG: CPBP family intramembrane glutamic endopeptidase [Candidatus Eisenbacteria bacterium]
MTHGLTAVDHLLALVLAIFFPIRSATFGYRHLKRAADADVPRVRMWLYRQAMTIQWTLVAGLAVLWVWRVRSWAGLGLVWHPDARTGWTAAVVAALIIGVAVQLPRALRDPEALARIRRRLGHVRRMMPAAPHEMRTFYLLSFTAGVCEELLYRGYLLWYARHFLPWPAAAVLAVVLFGIGHSYQGPGGILTTMIAGAALMTLYLTSGSLYIPMLVHTLMDSYSGTLGRRAFAAEPAAAGVAAAEAVTAPPAGP